MRGARAELALRDVDENRSRARRGAADREELDSFDVPPVSSCVLCGSSSCVGSCARPERPGSPGAPTRYGFLEAALAATLEPERFFGPTLPRSSSRALAFACLAELLAVGSYAVPAVGLALAFDGSALERWTTLKTAFVLWLCFVLVVVLLHLLWGASLELGLWISGRPSDSTSGLSFSSYSCGWDLVTSPFGVFWLLRRLGTRGTQQALGAALRAPRAAVRAYLEGARRLDARGVQLAQRGAWFGFSSGFLVLVAGVAYGTWRMIADLG